MVDKTAVDLDRRVKTLSAFVQFEHELRVAEGANDVAYIAVNDGRQVIEYRQAFIWRLDSAGRMRVSAASGISEIDHQSPAIQQFLALAVWAEKSLEQDKCSAFTAGNCDVLTEELSDIIGAYLCYSPLYNKDGERIGGIIAGKDGPWNEGQLLLSSLMAEAVSHAWNGFYPAGVIRGGIRHIKKYRYRYLMGFVFLFLLPVRQYVLAPAEVVPRTPFIVAAPMDGVIGRVLVDVNQQVNEGDLLFSMEDTDLINRHAVSQKAVQVAEAEYMRNAQQAFECGECRAKIPELLASLEYERAKTEWANALLNSGVVRAPYAGVVSFSDVNDLLGRPVSIGQRIMTLSNPEDTRLKINLPVSDAIQLEAGSSVTFYPSGNPLKSYRGKLHLTSFEPVAIPGEQVVLVQYSLFDEGSPRLGMRGTAKLYGGWAPSAYLIFRKPISWIRRTFGI